MPDIVGTWRLVETEARDPDGSPLPDRYAPYGQRPMGIVTFTADGRMMAVLCDGRSEEHTSELQSLMRISYAVFCLKKKTKITTTHDTTLRILQHTHT